MLRVLQTLCLQNIEEKQISFWIFFFFFAGGFTKLWIKNIDVDGLPEVVKLC